MSLLKITKENFDNLINDGKVTLVDFYADWCGPCRALGPTINELANELVDLNIGKVNVDQESDLASQFGVRSIPTMIVFKNGKEIDRMVGLLSKEEIINKLR